MREIIHTWGSAEGQQGSREKHIGGKENGAGSQIGGRRAEKNTTRAGFRKATLFWRRQVGNGNHEPEV